MAKYVENDRIFSVCATEDTAMSEILYEDIETGHSTCGTLTLLFILM